MSAVPALMERADADGGKFADNLSVVALHWEDDYVDQEVSEFSVQTQTMQLGAVTTRLDKFGHNSKYKTELSDDEIEHAIEEIRSTIQKYSK